MSKLLKSKEIARASNTNYLPSKDLDFFGTKKKTQNSKQDSATNENESEVLSDDEKEVVEDKSIRDKHQIFIKGTKVPNPIDSFEQLFKRYYFFEL